MIPDRTKGYIISILHSVLWPWMGKPYLQWWSQFLEGGWPVEGRGGRVGMGWPTIFSSINKNFLEFPNNYKN